MTTAGYELVKLPGGTHSLRSLAADETLHPGIGPAAEAEALYVRQLQLLERLRRHEGEFVIWDVGLGAAANALTVLKAAREIPCAIRLVSFDHTIEPIEFALRHSATLGYFDGNEQYVRTLIERRRVVFERARQSVNWELRRGDFPALLTDALSRRSANPIESPHAILFDPFSPAKNPAMWTLSLFIDLFQLLDPARSCALATYSRSTMTRATLLSSGFFVGRGRAVGRKEETTLAANTPDLIAELLDRRWLDRARRSHSAEPLREPVYRRAPLSAGSWEKLRVHPQFR